MTNEMLLRSLLATLTASVVSLPQVVAAQQFSDWGVAGPVVDVNSAAADGCPIESPDGLSLYLASTRTGTLGGNDIWAADRASLEASWSEPQNLGMPVNSTASDYCPTPLRGKYLLFVSERLGVETCNAGPGSGDIYLVRQSPSSGWSDPEHLGCLETGTGPNSVGAEFSPALLETEEGTFLYFSSNVSGNMDIYVSLLGADGRFGAPSPVQELNTEFDDRMPSVSKDGREIVFSSTRQTDAKGTASFGSQDVFTSSRPSISELWSSPVNLGGGINTAGSETRASLSWDGNRLYFGRDGEIYMSTRQPVHGAN
jgi:hypothetical protein